MNKISQEGIDKIIDYYVVKEYNLEQIYRELGYAPATSKKYLLQNGVKIKSAAHQSSRNVKIGRDKFRKYNINKSYFNTWSKNMAYILGFLISDGSVNKNRVKLSLQRQDRYILEAIRDEVGYTGEIHDYKTHLKSTNKDYYYSELKMTCYEWIGRLSELYVYPNNTFTSKFPPIPDVYVTDFIRGVFDGDGGTKKGRYLRTFFTNGSFELIEGIAIKLRNLGLSERNINRSKNNYHYIEYAQKDSLKLYDLIYYEGCLCLHRKKEVFEMYL